MPTNFFINLCQDSLELVILQPWVVSNDISNLNYHVIRSLRIATSQTPSSSFHFIRSLESIQIVDSSFLSKSSKITSLNRLFSPGLYAKNFF
mmetsp:Transcript_18425/g.38650  ORF Transcript_18425/g.38650 Transcript_18425/m.38650 type:complete len:92 (-) Transcript_18425:285-560(-)